MAHRTVAETPLGRLGADVRRRLLEQITSGALVAGQRLGAERDLAVEFGVSRSTLRQALSALEADGTVRRVSGRGGGTFIAANKVERDLSRVVGVPALLRDQGFTTGSRVLSASVVTADTVTAKALRIEPGDFVCEVTRIRLADGSPLSLENVRLSAERFPGLLERSLGGSLYELLETEYGVRPAHAEERIEVVAATEDEGLILGVAAGAPLLSIIRTSWDAAGVPIEHSYDLFRADRTRITVHTNGQACTAAARGGHAPMVEVRARP